MTASSGAGLSKGLQMIAAYRAERLGQRQGGHPPAQSAGPAAGSDSLDDAKRQAEATMPVGGETASREPGSPHSVFAGLVNGGAASIGAVGASAGEAAAAPSPWEWPVRSSGSYDPPLAEMGFGPSMLIRLGQIGLRTVGDLARTDATRLRAELGEISRLVDVDGWILRARQVVGSKS